jgi:NADPH:quinone reductase-like Zn-dependent oxidoreductase
MKAVGYFKSLPIAEAEALIDVTAEAPAPTGRDLRVSVRAVSVNPIDTKVRMRAAPNAGEPAKILGYDAAGVVDAVGPEVSLFKPGDEVFYAGSITRSGTNAELQLVDERIVGRKPRSLSFAQAAAGKAPDGRTLLVIGGAGGVGSILIQLGRRLTALTVIATASRPETKAWCEKLGAHHVIDHSKPLAEQLKAIGHPEVAMVASLTGTDQHFPAMPALIAPQGKFALIDDPKALDVMPLKYKSIALVWETMFTRSLYGTPDMIAQHKLLNEVSAMVDEGLIITTMAKELTPINAANLKQAHALIESGKSIGKVVLKGW